MAVIEELDQDTGPTSFLAGVATEVFGTSVIQGRCNVGSVFRGGDNESTKTQTDILSVWIT
jgi:hypothetical protein